jgi:hypothetical protein
MTVYTILSDMLTGQFKELVGPILRSEVSVYELILYGSPNISLLGWSDQEQAHMRKTHSTHSRYKKMRLKSGSENLRGMDHLVSRQQC